MTADELSARAAEDWIRFAPARGILSRTSGFLRQAGFTHSLTPARNCTYGCLYCYVPTMRIQGGLQAEDWRRWGQFTTLKQNAAALLRRELRPQQRIYCSPLTDPYQPAEKLAPAMPDLLRAAADHPPAVFVLQTRGPLVLRDRALIARLAERCTVRVSFSLTTDREEVRRRYEPHCETIAERLAAMRKLREAGVLVHATLAPLLPCNPEALAQLALEATDQDVLGDPLHVRAVKPRGATTREAASRLAERYGEEAWLDAAFQQETLERVRRVVNAAGRRFGVGPEGFGWLAQAAL